ncbi:uncharacterized protein LOC103570675 [Microplitis demolitor]|uniref:uncharacterized protein LOC103570675 n=1 Tax=Microplitis demolitor TaxID=69319 RepID=UPI0004CD12E3|nr:uncharacterized protein LOC103570675 [Microplitis demolitor]XP_008546720.1 uncharacterized protein LOC103570675 [Microplitis demolitor]
MDSKFGPSIIRSIFLISCWTLLIANVKSVSNPVTQVKSVDIINEFTTFVNGMQDLIDLIKNDDSDEVFKKKVTDKLNDIYNTSLKIEVEKVINRTRVMEAKPDPPMEFSLLEDMNYVSKIDNKLHTMEDLYKLFLTDYDYINNDPYGSIKESTSSITDNGDIENRIAEILEATGLTITVTIRDIFEITVAYLKYKKNYHLDCNDISAYDRLYYYYTWVAKTITKGYTMIILSYQYHKLHLGDPNFYRNKQILYLNKYKKAMIHITKSVQQYLNSNDNINFKSSISCDPQSWKEGENYIRIKNYVSVRTSTTPHYGFINSEPDKRGIEYECPNFAEYADSAVQELIATKHCTSPFSPSTQYSSFSEFTDYATRIMERKCALGSDSVLKDHCFYDRNSDPILSVRKLSLSLQTCKTEINEVVTNARFHVQEGIISIEVQCGTFVNGKVDSDTLRWNTDDRRYTRENHPNYVVLSALLRSFNLDDIVLPEGEFVTGMKFEKLDDNRLSLVIQGTEMYDSNNRIISGQTSLRFPQNTGNSREKIDLFLLTTPLEMKNQTYEMSESGRHYIELTESKESYTYQSIAIVPFLDMQPVSLWRAAPLGGLGLFYKSQPGYAGFLAFKHISPKYVHFISENYAEKLANTSPA